MWIDELTYKSLIEEVINIRRHLHKYPEISEKEYKTCEYIRNYLNNIGINNKVVGDTGVVGSIINDYKYPTIALRAEMDALPIYEENSCEYKSKNVGVMHACGHDGIVATVLGLAKLLQKNKESLKCNIKLIFEPAEEVGKGARKLINEKVLENPRVDKMIIFHFANSQSIGMEIQKNVSTAIIGRIAIDILGKSSHWGDADKGINAISVSGKVINAIDEINDEFKDKISFVLGMGIIKGGIKNNIMADKVSLEGTLRAFSEDDFLFLLNNLKKRMNELEKQTGAKIKVNLKSMLPNVINDPYLVEVGSRIGKEIFNDKYVLGTNPYLAGDNAAYYFQLVPGVRIVFFAEKENEINYPLHNNRFDFNEDIFYHAIKTLFKIIVNIR